MMSDWRLPDSILVASHRWPLILLFVLMGGLVGMIAAFVWPSPFRASTEIYVGLNPYRALEDQYVAAFAQTEFRNVDDYKYWQMQQLNGLALADGYLQETLSKLEPEDEHWQSVSVAELREMLIVYWRNAGEWRLVAESVDPHHASQAVRAWREVIVKNTDFAITNSQELYRLELQLRSITDAQLESQMRLEALEEVNDALRTWQNDLSSRSDTQPPTTLEHWQLWSLAAQAASSEQNWRRLLEEIPSPQALAGDYLDWIEKLINSVATESVSLSTRLDTLDRERSRIFEHWQQTFQNGRGLAATLQIEPISGSAPVVEKVRSTPLAILVGGVLGFFSYAGFIFAGLSRGAKE